MPSIFSRFAVTLLAVSAAGGIAAKDARNQLQSHIDIGMGYDSNIFRAPDRSYLDFSKSNDPATTVDERLVVPQVKSGVFLRPRIEAGYRHAAGDDNYLAAEYRFNGRYYAEDNYSNANQYDHALQLGDRYHLNRDDTVYAGWRLGKQKKLYLDRDTGKKKVVGGVDVSERYVYTESGLEAEFDKRSGALQFYAQLQLLERDYHDPVVISEYDHDYQGLDTELKYKFNPGTKFSVGYRYSRYEYRERPSRDELGRFFRSNPALQYTYNRYTAGLRQRLHKNWLMYLDYEYKTREDAYVAYNDYAKSAIKARLIFDYDRDTQIKLSYGLWERDYPNAFAFDNVLQEQKKYDGSGLELQAERKLNAGQTLWLEIKQTVENSTDSRYAYARAQTTLGYRWEYD